MNMTHLFTSNASVDALDIALYTAENAQSKAVDIIVGDTSVYLKKQMKNNITDDPSKTMGLYSLVSLATTAKYDFATNLMRMTD